MISPPLLKPGDKIGIVAPGRKISVSEIEAAHHLFTKWGLEVMYSSNLCSKHHSYLAGSDQERLTDMQSLFDSDDITAIICARGGYGTTRFLDSLDFSALLEKPKWIAGFSDVTALHLRLSNLNIKSIHGTMPILFSNPDSHSSVESLRKSLMGEGSVLDASNNKYNRHGKATAEIIGGNLSLIVDSIGTSGDPNTSGKILVLEEIDEHKYKVDRMLMHLKRSGKLNNLAGLVIGHMTDLKDSDIPFGESVEEIVLSKTVQGNYPIAFGFPIGHQNPNLAWVHGSTMTLNVNERGSQLIPVL